MSNTFTINRKPALHGFVEDWKLLVAAVLLSVMVFIRDLGFFSFTPPYFLLVYTIASLFLSYRSLQSFFFFQIPFECAVHGICLIPLLFALVLKAKKRNASQFIFAILILLFELFHFCSYSFDTDFNQLVVYGLNLFLFFYMLFDDQFDNETIKKGVGYYIFGTSVIVLIIMLHSIASFGISETLYGALRIGGDHGAFAENEVSKTMYASMNANTLAFFSVTAMTLLMCVDELFRRRIIKWFFLSILLLAGLLTSSRTWLLVTAFTVVLYFLSSGAKGRIGLIIVAFLLFFAADRFLSITESLSTRFEERMSDDDLSTAGQRTDLFVAYNRFLQENPNRIIYGTGAIYYKSVCGIWNSVHNGIQQVYVSYGIIGSFIFILCVCVFFHRYIRRRKVYFKLIIPFIACFLFDQSIQFLNPFILMLPFVATVLPMRLVDE